MICGEVFETAVAEIAPGTPVCSLVEPFGDPSGRMAPRVCLGCGAVAALGPAILCAECGALPCICAATELG